MFDPELKPAICDSCDKEIASGLIAIICKDRRYAFAYSPQFAAIGPIIEVSPEVMDKVEEEAKKQKPPTEGEN